MSELAGIIGEVAIAILSGAALLAPRVSVGPRHPAVGPVYWACIEDPGGVERIGSHRVPEVDQWGELDAFYEDDTSPFGAARLFVHLAGVDAARAALRVLRGEPDEEQVEEAKGHALDVDEDAATFGAFAAACVYCVTPSDPAPIKGRLAALHVATMGPLPHCKLKPPEHWPDGMVGRWLASGGGAEVLGPCSQNCPERT